MTIYRASLDTRHFSFEAYGNSEDQAVDVLKQGLRQHGKQYQIPHGAKWMDPFLPDIQIQPFEIGEAYRDGEKL